MNFKDRAKSWDNEATIKRSKIIAKKIVDVVGENKKYSVMEYGCATGLIGFNLCDKYKKITFMDSEEEMLNRVKEKNKSYKFLNISTTNIDLTKEEYSKEKFDIIYTSLKLHQIIDLEKIIKIFYNLLNEKGILFIIDLDTDDGSFHMDTKDFNGYNGFEHHYIENILKNSGFSNLKSETFFHGIRQVKEKAIPYSIFYTVGYKS